MEMKISPSILASDYANLQTELEKISTSDLIHVDVMDGHFVPNISIGAPVVESIKKVCSVPFDVHLMISEPFSTQPVGVNILPLINCVTIVVFRSEIFEIMIMQRNEKNAKLSNYCHISATSRSKSLQVINRFKIRQ